MEVSLLSHFTNSAMIVYLIQWLKGTQRYQRFAAWLPIADTHVHVVMSALGAFATAIGMHGTVKGTSDDGWMLTLAIPPLWIVLHASWDWAQQFALNQLVFAITVQQKEAAPVITAQLAPKIAVTAPLEVKAS